MIYNVKGDTMHKKWFIIILAVAFSLIATVAILTTVLGIEHTNAIYFWIMLYAYAIGTYLITRTGRRQIEELEELVRKDIENEIESR